MWICDDISAVTGGFPPGPGSKCCFSGAKCIGWHVQVITETNGPR